MIERFPYARILLLFFSFVSRTVEDQFEPLKADLHGARLPTTYHGYLARSLVYALVTFVVVLSLLIGLSVFYLRPVALTTVNPLLLFGGLVFPSLIVAYVVYRGRLFYPKYVADERARRIELSMANVVNFLLALSRAGVPTGKALGVVSVHADILGEAAAEFRYSFRDMEYFGADVIGALNRLSATTPLLELSEFIDGYVRALTGRGDIDLYLEEEMEKLFEQAELEQGEFLARLGVLAEVYVAVFVALPIFGLIILLVMGFIGGNVLTGIRVVVYAVIPLSAIGYLLLLDIYMASPLAGAGEHEELQTVDLYEQSLHRVPTAARGDRGDLAAAMAQLERYQFRQRFTRFLAAPMTLMRREPRYALYLGVEVGLLYFLVKASIGLATGDVPFVAPVPVGGDAEAVLRAIDDSLIEAVMLVLLVYGIFYELRSRYLAEVERVLPEFLNELSERHEVGMSLSESIRDLGVRDMGPLDEEIDRMLRDLELGSAATEVLRRFANRVRSPVVTRVVVLLTAASDTAERLGPIIEALSDRAELSQRLNRERQVEMSLYVIIIYIAFFVFLVILAVLNDVFLPRIPEGGIGVGGVGGPGFDPVAYETIFYHSTVLQALFGGLVGGKMSEGRISAGVKHSLVMMLVAYGLFTVVLPFLVISL